MRASAQACEPAATDRPRMGGFVIEWTLRGARAQGLDVAAILRRAGVAPEFAAWPHATLCAACYAALVRTLKRVMRDEMWGLCRERVPPGSFGAACEAAIHGLNLGDALRIALDHYRRRPSDLAPRLRVAAGLAQVQFRHAGRGEAGRAEAARVLFTWHACRFAAWLTGQSIPLVALNFSGEPSLLAQQASHWLAVPSRHRQPYDGFCFDACWLELAVVRTASDLRRFLPCSLDDPSGRADVALELGEQVRRYLRQRLAGQSPSMEQVAQALSLSTTSLTRRLQDEGLGFQYLKDGLRCEVSMQYLQASRLPLDEIAYRVGFSEPATFCRAFKKWTGSTPKGFRVARSAQG